MGFKTLHDDAINCIYNCTEYLTKLIIDILKKLVHHVGDVYQGVHPLQ